MEVDAWRARVWRYDPVPLPALEPGGEPRLVSEAVLRWTSSAPLRDLVVAFGGEASVADPAASLPYLASFSARAWDFRQGRERPDAPEPMLDEVTRELALDAAAALGMRHTRPLRRSTYDHLLILGGYTPACLQRIYYAAQLLRDGAATAGRVTVLGSFRRLRPEERDLAAAFGIGRCRHELDVIVAGVRSAFGIDRVPVVVGGSPGDAGADHPEPGHTPAGVRVDVLAAAASRPEAPRATTVDTYRELARRVAWGRSHDLLVVTSALYVPYQHWDAVRIIGLPRGCGIETVGVDASFDSSPLLRQRPTTGNYLQEIRSAIESAGRLLKAVDGGSPP